MTSKVKKSKDKKDIGQMPSRRKTPSRKTRKYIRRALLENYPGMAKKYNKADLDKVIDKQYELDTILPLELPIYYQEYKNADRVVDSKPVKKRPGQGQLFRYNNLDEAENAQRTINRDVKYDHPTSSPDRDLESGRKQYELYDFSGRPENYDPEDGTIGGRKATRKSRKSVKSRKTRK
jgi:hypothetical protein